MENRLKKGLIFEILILGFWVGCVQTGNDSVESPKVGVSSCHELMKSLLNPEHKNVIVIAHRGDWRNAPENSLASVQSCINMGVDAIEIDIRETKDGHLVLMHDQTLDRTTTGSGLVSEWTLDSLKTLFLKNGAGMVTSHRIPTLAETLESTRNKILITPDIKGELQFARIFELLKTKDMLDQAFFGSYLPLNEARDHFGVYLDSIHYFPALRDESSDILRFIKEYEEYMNPPVFIAKFTSDTSHIVSYLDTLKNRGNRIWMHSITASRTGGHHDDRALYDPEGSYGWLLAKGVNVIQTDRPQLLLSFLRKKQLHH